MTVILCIAIVSETIEKPVQKRLLGKRKLGECGLPMEESENSLYACTQGHKMYYPFNKHDLKAKMKGIAQDGTEGYY